MAEGPEGSERVPERRARSQAALTDFLDNEINLGLTYLATAKLATDPAHSKSLLEQVRRILVSARLFCGRLENRDQWHAVHDRLNRLEEALDAFSGEPG